MDAPEDCRICSKAGQYDLFNDELSFDMKEMNKIKIYIVLNNFLYEKLYAPDEHSSSICLQCCNDLCDAYTFMTRVRKSEVNVRNGQETFIQKTSKQRIVQEIIEEPTEEISLIQEDVMKLEEEFLVTDEASDTEENLKDREEVYDENYILPIEDEPELKKPKVISQLIGSPECIFQTHFELEQYTEKDQNIITLNVVALCVERPREGSYKFDTSQVMQHADASAIYKCKMCVKAFSNAEFLVKHTTASHLCLICMAICENYKDLSKHTKENHSVLVCHFCQKTCASSSNFRMHMKTKHMLNAPPHVGILGYKTLK